MKTYSNEEIRRAKEGTHHISWAPGQDLEEVSVSRVRGATVWIRLTDGSEARLNGAASRALIRGAYREDPRPPTVSGGGGDA